MSLLESARVCHADIEQCQQEIIEEFKTEPVTQKQQVLHEHFIKRKVDVVGDRAAQLLSIYESEDFKNIGSENPSRVVSSFYTRLAELREYHRRFQQSTTVEAESEGRVELISEDDLPVSFSAEECYGKYVDLHDIYQEYNNLKFNFDNPTVNTTEANQGANPLALAAARHQSIDYATFLQVSSCPLPVAYLPGACKGRMQLVGGLGRLNALLHEQGAFLRLKPCPEPFRSENQRNNFER